MSLPIFPASSSPHPARKWAILAAYLVAAGTLGWHVWATVASPSMRWTMIDMQVYRDGITAALNGSQVYGQGFTSAGLDFLYPPFAVLALAPLALVSLTTAKLIMTAVNLVALVTLCGLSWSRTAVARQWHHPLTVLSAGVLLVSEPMQQNLQMGQVNVALAAMVLIDFLLPEHHRAKGALIGLAAAIKLTPLVGVLFYLLSGRRRAALRAAISFGAATLLALVIWPSLGASYLAAGLGSNTGNGYLGNQSLLALIFRFGTALGWSALTVKAVWLIGAIIIGLGGTWLLARRRPDDQLLAYCGVATITLLVSPLSWTPHWISLLPLVIWAAGRCRRPAGRLGVLLVAAAALFVWPVGGVWSGLIWTVYPAGYLSHASVLGIMAYPLISNLYVLCGFAAAFGISRAIRSRSGGSGPAGRALPARSASGEPRSLFAAAGAGGSAGRR